MTTALYLYLAWCVGTAIAFAVAYRGSNAKGRAR